MKKKEQHLVVLNFYLLSLKEFSSFLIRSKSMFVCWLTQEWSSLCCWSIIKSYSQRELCQRGSSKDEIVLHEKGFSMEFWCFCVRAKSKAKAIYLIRSQRSISWGLILYFLDYRERKAQFFFFDFQFSSLFLPL